MCLTKFEISVELGENDYDPQRFVDAAVYSEDLGFRTVWFGDHIFPWFHSGKRSAFVWSVLGVALSKTHKVKVGPWVTVPIGARYHPAIIAQAAATLDNMFPGRVQLGVGAGEALNERPFWNGRWPKWDERMDRLTEGITLMRKLWESKEPFKFEGKYFYADFYYLYTKPRRKIPLYLSAIGRRAAFAAGKYADGLITIGPRNDAEKISKVIMPEYERGRKSSSNERPRRVAVEILFSLQSPEELVTRSWRTLGILRKDSWSIPDPMKVEEEGRKVTVGEVRQGLHACKNWRELVRVVETYRQIGVNECTFTIGCNKRMMKALADNVLSVF